MVHSDGSRWGWGELPLKEAIFLIFKKKQNQKRISDAIVSKALNLLLRGGFDLVTQSIVSGQGCQALESFSALFPLFWWLDSDSGKEGEERRRQLRQLLLKTTSNQSTNSLPPDHSDVKRQSRWPCAPHPLLPSTFGSLKGLLTTVKS